MTKPAAAAAVERAVSKHILMQLAIRAHRRVHLDAQLFSLGQYDDGKTESIRRINQGAGIELAPESAVRDALAQEFNASKLAHGWKIRAGVNPNDPEARYFGVIDREVAYEIDGHAIEHVDLQYQRVPGPGETDKEYPFGPVELKRARLVSPDFPTGNARVNRKQVNDVQTDARKLARFVRAERIGKLKLPAYRKPKGTQDRLHPQILVWGCRETDPPLQFMKDVFNAVKRCGCKPFGKIMYEFVPAVWDGSANGGSRKPQVLAWFWIALATLRVSKNGCGTPQCGYEP